MAWQRESLAAIVQRFETRISSALDIASPLLPVSVAKAISRACAGAIHALNGAMSETAKQIHPQTADAENLAKMAEADGVYRTLPTYARYVSGALYGVASTAIPKGTTLKAPNGVQYATVADYTANDPITVDAITIGVAGNQAVGTVLTFDPQLAGAGTSATISGGVDGTDLEDLEAYRGRYLAARRAERLGGHESEYVQWTKTVPGVTRVWVYPREFGLGTVAVYFVRDGDAAIIPSLDELAAVSTVIAKKRPALADVVPNYVRGPIALQLMPLTISGVSSLATRAKIEEELKDAVWTYAEIGNSLGRGTIYEAHIEDAIRRATKSFTLVTTGDHACDAEKLITLGTITWII